MFRLPRSFARGLRVRALRELYRLSLLENTRHARGLRLLRDWLSPEQLDQFDAEGQFDVIGCDSGKRYRIRHGTSTNVYEVDRDGKVGTAWCFLPAGRLVAGDVMLAQKIALETSESRALAVANRLPPLLIGARNLRLEI